MGFLDKLKFNQDVIEDDEEYDNDDYNTEYDDEPTSFQKPAAEPVKQQFTSAPLELKVVKPEKFELVPQIADHLLNKRTVVLNLESTNKETARRILDFLSGVAYSIEGHMKRVANNTYVITPKAVEVTGEQLRDKEKEKEEVKKSDDIYGEL